MSNNGLWVWGYVLKKVPDEMMFVYRTWTYCSLETAGQYLGADNAVFMDPCTDRANLNDELFQYLSGFKQVICGLQHGHYAETARLVSEFSLTHPNITGALIDDFRDPVGPSGNMTVEELKEVYEALKSVNPALKLYLVRYHMRQAHEELIPYRDYFDGISQWCWVSTEHFWQALYHYDIAAMHRVLPDKEILQGQFIHHYGVDCNAPMPQEMLELQSMKISAELRDHNINGWVILQNGYMCCLDHRRQVQWLKSYLDWFYGTHTFR